MWKNLISQQKTLKICTHYKVGDHTIDYFPITPELLLAEPVYTEVPGWDGDITEVRDVEKVPAAANRYVETFEQLVGVPIKYVSVGPEREALIIR